MFLAAIFPLLLPSGIFVPRPFSEVFSLAEEQKVLFRLLPSRKAVFETVIGFRARRKWEKEGITFLLYRTAVFLSPLLFSPFLL